MVEQEEAQDLLVVIEQLVVEVEVQQQLVRLKLTHHLIVMVDQERVVLVAQVPQQKSQEVLLPMQVVDQAEVLITTQPWQEEMVVVALEVHLVEQHNLLEVYLDQRVGQILEAVEEVALTVAVLLMPYRVVQVDSVPLVVKELL